jgi:formylmethanofuran dehydrogenase subunit E-like metal-binding protein
MQTLSVTPDAPGFMVLTNAGYGQADAASTEAYLDVVARTTGRTPGTRTLLLVNTPCTEPLWFTVFRKDNQAAVFIKLTPEGFKSQSLDLSPASLFQPEGWAAARKGLVGTRLFSVASISLSWAEDAPWPMLKGAELHDHFCPGLNAGFMVKAYLDKNLPLGPGDAYVFVGAPPICAMDALQSAYGATMGKHGAYSVLSAKAADKHAKDGVAPTLIAMRVNKGKDTCEGVFIGFDWAKSESFTGVTAADRTPPGGKKNPLFYISRVKMSWKLARMDMDDKLACIKDLGRFNGPASLAGKVAGAGADPYAVALSD